MGNERIIHTGFPNGQTVCLFLDRPVTLQSEGFEDKGSISEYDDLSSILNDPLNLKYHSLAMDLNIHPNISGHSHIPKEHIKRKKAFDRIRAIHRFFVVAYEGVWQVFDKELSQSKLIKFAIDTAPYSRSQLWDVSVACLGISRAIYPRVAVDYSTVFAGLAGLGITRSVAFEGLGNFLTLQTALKNIYRDPLSSELYRNSPDIFDAPYMFSEDHNRQNHANNFSEYWRE